MDLLERIKLSHTTCPRERCLTSGVLEQDTSLFYEWDGGGLPVSQKSEMHLCEWTEKKQQQGGGCALAKE